MREKGSETQKRNRESRKPQPKPRKTLEDQNLTTTK